MKRLILTSSHGADLAKSRLAEIVVLFFFRFVWEPLPSPEYLDAFFGAQSGTLKPGDHWSDWGTKWPAAFEDRRNLPLADFCEPYDVIDLWFEPSPVDQLQLIWLLDYFGAYPKLLKKLKLRLVPVEIFKLTQGVSRPSVAYIRTVDITSKELETAAMAWQSYRAPTPEACADLLRNDLSPC